MLNRAQLIGHLGQDPEIRSTQGGQSVGSLRVATTEKRKDRDGNWTDHTEWHTVTVWGSTAENCGKYLKKGSQVYVEGRIQTRKWQDKEGKDRYSTEIVAENVRFLGGRGDGERREPRQEPRREPAPRTGGGGEYTGPAGGDAFPPDDDQIPFVSVAYIRHGRDI